jgi:hypothetical protein
MQLTLWLRPGFCRSSRKSLRMPGACRFAQGSEFNGGPTYKLPATDPSALS